MHRFSFSFAFMYSDVTVVFFFRVPIVFKDDLAQVAASHLKENDLVYVSGQLTCDVPPLKLDDGQANIQVLAHLLSFVDSKVVETDVVINEEEEFMEVVKAEKKVEEKRVSSKYPPGTVSGYKSMRDKFNKLWNDVITRPQDWTDNRPQKKNGSVSILLVEVHSLQKNTVCKLLIL
jgi:hypothetical protein